MTESNWELIAKHLAKETSPDEETLFAQLMDTDAEFSKEYQIVKNAWDHIKLPANTFNKERIIKLRDKKLKAAMQRKRNRSLLKYAAIFIGFLMGALFVYHDINSSITIVADANNRTEITLPDGSVVLMKKDASIRYRNSMLLSFDREVTLNGQAYFEITKSPKGKHFVVKTHDYNIEVFGTKFDVNTNREESRVVLTEGKIYLNHFMNSKIGNTEIMPGQMAYIEHNGQQLSIRDVNTSIYTSWTNEKLHFEHFSISELGEIFDVQYHKTLVVNKNINLNNKVGGSAPSDDLQLIIKGLSIVLKREIIQRNDTIFIK